LKPCILEEIKVFWITGEFIVENAFCQWFQLGNKVMITIFANYLSIAPLLLCSIYL